MAFPFILFNFIKSKWKSDLKLYEKTIKKTKKKQKLKRNMLSAVEMLVVIGCALICFLCFC